MDVQLIMYREDGTRRSFQLGEGATTIGRKTDCGIRVPLSEVSRHHAEVVIEDGGAVLRDLGGTNGTYLNNRRIDDEEDLEPGDQIMIGPVVFTVQIDGDPPDEEIIPIKTKLNSRRAGQAAAAVSAAPHVSTSDDDVDPIAALEALASSADQTAINPEDED
jgi:pSer/pThr/pTyr-binding forkhead associated (FHA) protein